MKCDITKFNNDGYLVFHDIIPKKYIYKFYAEIDNIKKINLKNGNKDFAALYF